MTNGVVIRSHLCAPQTTVASRDKQQTPQHPRSRVLHITNSDPANDFDTRSHGCNLGCKIIPRATHAHRFTNIQASAARRQDEFG